ncbi:MAG TPA: ABC transporter ATP-binding protein [Acidobacteriaceae bacterium]|nr:ABC transporter ATP-binding protein [Acidobacteriaceae bacterium]
MTDRANELAIETRDLVKRYGSIAAVDGLSLSVPRGAVYALVGRNGSGKTTTIRMLLDLSLPDAGTARVLGMDCHAQRVKVLERVGYVSDRPLPSGWTGEQLVRLNRGFYSRWSDELVARYVRVFDIPMKQRFRNLSRGNQTKMWLMLALAQQPDVLILDEPTAGLDPVVTDQLLRVLVDDVAAEGRTVFMSSHHLSEIERIADWVGMIDKGKLLLEAPMEELRARFRRIQVAGVAEMAMPVAAMRVRRSGASTEYVVRDGAEEFVDALERGGATVLHSSPMNLSEIFLECLGLEGKELDGKEKE